MEKDKINYSEFLENSAMGSLIDTIPAMIWITDSEGYCTYLNKQWYLFTGQTHTESEGFGWLDGIHPDEKELSGSIFLKANQNQHSFSIKYRLKAADGNFRWCLDRGNPRHDKEGNYIGMVGTVIDIHDQIIAEEDSKRYLRSVVENAPFPIGVYEGKEMKIALANQSILNVFGKGDDIIGKLYSDVNPELENQKIFEQLEQVYETGIPFHAENQYIDIIDDGKVRPYYFNYRFTPLFDSNGNVYGVMNTAADVTELNIAKKEIEESSEKFRAIFEEAPVATCLYTGRDLIIEIANEKMLSIWGKGNSVMGKPLAEALPELRSQRFLQTLDTIFDTGETFVATEQETYLIVNGVPNTYYFDFIYKPLFNSEEHVYAIMDMAVDVTDRVATNQRIEANQKQLLDSFEQSPVGIAVIKSEDLTFTMANTFYAELVGRTSKEIIGKPLLEALPEIEGQGFDDLLRQVITTGVPFIATEVSVDLLRNGQIQTIYVDLAYQPHRGNKNDIIGVLVVATDVTQQVHSRRNVEISEAKLRSVIASAPAGIGLFVGRELVIEMPNKTFTDIVGKGPDIAGKPLREVMPELLSEGQPFLKILDDVFTTGVMFQSYGSEVRIIQNGIMTYNFYNITYSPLFDENGEVYAILDIAIDVTDTIVSKQKAEEAEAALRGAVELAEMATWSLDIKSKVYSYSQRFVEWLGFTEGTSFEDEVFDPIFGDFKYQVLEKIDEAIKPDASGTYINEHPIVNRITGQQRIIHAQAQVFYDLEGNPEILRGTAQDVTKERKLQQQLEFQVKKRTEELQFANSELALANSSLQKTNAELAQFAYIASHDLQEPARKINVFAKMLEDSLGDIDEQSKNYLSKLNNAAVRMMNLIRDVLAYSQLAKEHEVFVSVDLDEIVEHIVSDFDLIIEQKNARITFENLPVIEAIPLQMAQLFGNLISNSLKYSTDLAAPEITISATELSSDEAKELSISNHQNYSRIEFRDNGIGFDQSYAEQIFHIFQRLHGKTEYAGTGIGLAMCKKIAENHRGLIYATGRKNQGAVFVVILPKKQDFIS